MSLLPEGEILRVTRRQALWPLAIGAVCACGGLWITRLMMARGDSGLFLCAWGSIWFLGSGAAVFCGLRGLLRPPVFARLTEEGVTFASQHIRPILWRDLAAVRPGLRTVTRRNKTQTSLRTPLILTVRDVSVLKGEWKGFTFTHPGHALGDGTAEILLKTGGCPLSNDALLRLLGERAGIRPDLRPADPETATLGGVKLNQPGKRDGVAAYFGACVFLAFGVGFAGVGVNKLLHAHASRHWLPVGAEILSGRIKTSTHSSGRGGSSTSHTPAITYRYVVGGRVYTGDRAAFIYSASQENAGAFLRRFPVGARVTAYYDPRDPADAVLVRDGYGMLWIFVVFGAVFAAAGGWMLQRLIAVRREART